MHHEPGRKPVRRHHAPAGGTLDDGPGWAGVRASLDSEGIALTPPLLTGAECEEARGGLA